jgi:hypothetical protein
MRDLNLKSFPILVFWTLADGHTISYIATTIRILITDVNITECYHRCYGVTNTYCQNLLLISLRKFVKVGFRIQTQNSRHRIIL